MSIERVPLFSWSVLVATVVWLVTLPVLLADLVVAYLAETYEVTVGPFGAGSGIEPLAWVFEQPQIYALAIPLLGVLGDVLPTFSKVRQRYYGLSMTAIAAFGILSVGAWAQSSLHVDVILEAPFVAVGVLILLPVLLGLSLGYDTLARGETRLRRGGPLGFTALVTILLLLAVWTGAVRVFGQLRLDGTSYETAHTNLVFAAVLLGGLGGLHYWSAKLWGRTLGRGLSTLSFAGVFVGALLLALPDFVSGVLDQPAGPRLGAPLRDWVEPLNIVSLVGASVLFLVVLLLFIVNLLRSIRAKRERAPADPWGGLTLEWLASSPPAPDDFTELEPVTSERPLAEKLALTAGSSEVEED